MRLCRIRPELVRHPLPDVAAEVRRQLDGLQLAVPRGEVAVTAGSRGIAQIPLILRTVGDWLRERGAKPFAVPAMGSHGGATAEGQRRMLEGLGMTATALGMDIRASMEVARLGAVSTGDVWMDRQCFAAAGVVVVNRVKLHTCFAGPLQSGLVKMMVVGMGKVNSARTFHEARAARMRDMLVEMGALVLNSGKILAGLAILEDGCDQTAEIHALRPDEILQQEPLLLERHRRYFPRLPVDDLNVLIVKEIGKNYSGSGMDTNVIGYRGIKGGEDLDRPRIRVIAALGLSEQSQGNAFGVGLADFITRRLRDAMDEAKTLTNVLTAGEMIRAKIPATLPDDEQLIGAIAARFGERRWMFIANTLHLETLYVSEDLLPELRGRADCAVDSEPFAPRFEGGKLELTF